MIYSNLVDRALRTERPDLIVWPETSYPYPYVEIAPKLDSAGLERQMKGLGSAMSAAERRSQQDAIRNHLRGWTDQLKVAMLIGAVTYDHRPDGLLRYNSAILYQPGEAAVQSFHKLHLVPFGEYVPLVETFPWLIALTPYHGGHVPSLSFGPEPKWLALGPYRLAAVICFEDTVPQVVRRFFREAKDGRHPDLLVNMSNDGWFHGSSEHDMHLAVSVFRAVEHRVPMARAANTGISAIVDGNGRVVESLPKLKEGVLTGVVPLDDRAALYSVWGDWLGQSCLAVTIGLVPMAVLWPRLRARRGR
jgi:apolipoprotein N-acyltransferase